MPPPPCRECPSPSASRHTPRGLTAQLELPSWGALPLGTPGSRHCFLLSCYHGTKIPLAAQDTPMAVCLVHWASPAGLGASPGQKLYQPPELFPYPSKVPCGNGLQCLNE